MTDPYQVLGVSPSATDEQIKSAYRELARKYHPDNYVNNPLADLAQEKMKEINEAYDQIQRQRKQQQQSYSGQASANRGYSNAGYSRQSYSGQGRSQFADIRQLLNSNRLSEAEELLEDSGELVVLEVVEHDGEGYLEPIGWLDQAYSYYTRAVQMNPGNAEYQTALNQLMWQRNTGRPSGGYGDYRNVQSGGMSGCDMCSGLICADCCCECMGGDLISCC